MDYNTSHNLNPEITKTDKVLILRLIAIVDRHEPVGTFIKTKIVPLKEKLTKMLET